MSLLRWVWHSGCYIVYRELSSDIVRTQIVVGWYHTRWLHQAHWITSCIRWLCRYAMTLRATTADYRDIVMYRQYALCVTQFCGRVLGS